MRTLFADILSFGTHQLLKRIQLKNSISWMKSSNSLKLFSLGIMAILSSAELVCAQESNTLFDNDLALQLHSRSLPINQAVQGFYKNPGDMAYTDSLSLSEAYTGITRKSSDKSVYPQAGTGITSVNIGAKSFLHLDSKQSVWGNAQFSTGTYKDIKWSNCIDYQKIAPYVLGDEVGGNLSFRQYRFGGGYSYLMENGITVGASLNYRAEIAWRDRDPRVRTIVSDLDFCLGASYRYNENRLIGVSASLESYTQNCDLEFYNPLNQINTLPLTGFGSYNKRFAGNTNKNSGHSELGYHVGCHLGSFNQNGVQVDLWFKGIRMNQLLRNFNNITFAYTDTYITHTTVAYPLKLSKTVRIMPLAEGEYFHRLGTENLFDTASGASYDKIGSRSPYLNQQIDFDFSVPVEFNLSGNMSSTDSRTFLTMEPRANYHSLTEELTSLGRKIEVSTLSPEIKLTLNRLSDKWMYDIRGSYAWSNCLKDKWTFPGYDSSSALQESVASTFMMLSSSNSIFGGEVSISRKIGKMMIGFTASYSHRYYNLSGTKLCLKNPTSTSTAANPTNKTSSLSVSSVDMNQTKYHADNLDISLKINF